MDNSLKTIWALEDLVFNSFKTRWTVLKREARWMLEWRLGVHSSLHSSEWRLEWRLGVAIGNVTNCTSLQLGSPSAVKQAPAVL